jgi:hypothetical protein
MTTQHPAIFIQSEAHPAEDVRRYIEAAGGDREGILGDGSSVELFCQEKGTPDMSVDVLTGRCFILGTEDVYQGAYFCDNRGTENLAVAPAHATVARVDLVVAKLEDSDYSGVTDAWSLAVVDGSIGAPTPPATPANAIVLAHVAVAGAASSIVDANITDYRPFHNPGFEQVIYTSNDTWTKADYPWARHARIRLVAGGAGTAGVGSTAAGQFNCSGGGGGGAYAESTLPLSSLGTTEAVTVGAGGTGGVGAVGGSSGGTSSFGSHVSAGSGVTGGFSAAAAYASGALTGDGGTPTAGQIQAHGFGGTTGISLGISSANQIQGGNGGGSLLGGGTSGVRVGGSPTANPGLQYGGGGSGTGNNASSSALTGGDGFQGVVIVEMFG